ncbi:MATE family efflux transporter [Vibrio sp. WXL103]|uniref:MATE family efflux transporter n=1 Tax=Vibrio sp. WXL103 TaxID=3450710 RepID=UPI003EC68DBD
MRQLFKIGLPISVQTVSVAIIQLSDVLMVSSLGANAVAAIGIATRWYFVLIMVSVGIGTATSILVSQYWSKGDKNTVAIVSNYAINLGCCAMIFLTILLNSFAKELLSLQTSDLAVIELGASYIYYATPVLITTHVIIIFEAVLRASNNSFLPLILGITTSLLNIILNAVFIYGFWIIEPMGVSGVALATSAARLIQLFIFVAIFLNTGYFAYKISAYDKGNRLFDKFFELCSMSIMNSIIWALATLAYQVIIGEMGTISLALLSILLPFEGLCQAIIFGFASACSIIIGQSLGLARFRYVKQLARTYMTFSLVIGLTISSFILVNQTFISFNFSADQEIYETTFRSLYITCIILTFRSYNMFMLSILRAGGEHRFCLKIETASMWLIGIPCSIAAVFYLNLSFIYVYFIFVIDETIKALLLFLKFKEYKWLRDLTVSNTH